MVITTNLENFQTNQENINGFKCCTILGNVEYSHETLLLTFCRSNKTRILIILILITLFQVLSGKLNQCSKKCRKKISYNTAPLDLPK